MYNYYLYCRQQGIMQGVDSGICIYIYIKLLTNQWFLDVVASLALGHDYQSLRFNLLSLKTLLKTLMKILKPHHDIILKDIIMDISIDIIRIEIDIIIDIIDIIISVQGMTFSFEASPNK